MKPVTLLVGFIYAHGSIRFIEFKVFSGLGFVVFNVNLFIVEEVVIV